MAAPAPSTLAGHVRRTIVLGAPLVAAQIAQMLIGVTDTVMVGWLGTKELAAGTLAFQTFFIFLIFGLGFGAAMMPLIAAATGRDDTRGVRRATRMGLWALTGLALLFMVPLWFTEEILLELGQKAELAALAGLYMHIAQWSLLPMFWIVGLRSFLTSIERTSAVLLLVIATAILNGLFNYAFIFGNFGAPRLGIQGAAVATLLSNLIGASLSLFYVSSLKAAAPYQLFTRFWRPDWLGLREIVLLGVPISLTILAEAGLFSAASVMIGWLGAVQLAAHGIALQIASVAFMIPLGISQASSVRVGQAAGRRDLSAIGYAGHAAMLIAVFFALLSIIVMVTIPETLIRLFLDARGENVATVVAYAVPLLGMAALFQLVDSIQVVAAGNLRGLQDTRMPLVIASLSYWIVGIGIAYVLAFPLGLGGVGVWGGLAAGLASAAILLTLRFQWRERLRLIPSQVERLAA